ncbi:MAG: RNA polymerase factor sigma-54 [Kiritimatiellaeota bacterium]|nr:RNA polymerase factor sigma-54 [Kiritimatiellota bacterium]
MAPQQIQSLEVLLASIQELQMKISQELSENPTLEQVSPGNEELSGDILSNTESVQKNETPEERRENDDDGMAELARLADSWRGGDQNGPTTAFSAEAAEKRQYLFDSLTVEQSLQEYLSEQLRFLDIDDKTAELAELVIGSIDDSGYLRSITADLATVSGVSLEEMERVVRLVQTFDPPGICARDIKECLLLQLEHRGLKKTSLHALVRNHLDDVAANRLPLVAKRMKVTMDELREMLDALKHFNPHPGAHLAPDSPQFITPEATIVENEDGYTVVPNKSHIPKLRLSQQYLKILEDPTTPPDVKEYIREKLNKSKALMKSLDQRQSTIMRISEVILDTQHDFFEHGIEHLKPLTMQQVADRLGIHETTVSRAIANKHIQSPRGLFEYKFFFSSGYQSDSGEEVSNRSVMEKIKDIIALEDPKKPHSDQKISDMLKKLGLNVARRTVAKYRESMRIPTSNLRKEF